MTSVAASRLTGERKFYLGMALAMIALVLIGFGPSFYFKGVWSWPRPNPTLPPLVMLHGIVFSLWMRVFAAQAGLVAANRRDLHMRLGQAGFLFAAILIPLMYIIAIGQVERANQPPIFSPLSWTAVPLFPIPAFIVLLWLGWRYRRDAQAHKRLMLGAALLMMDPAIGRMPLAPPTLAGFAFANFLSWSLFVPLIVRDFRTRGGLHWATVTGAGLFAAALLLRVLVLAYPGLWEPVAGHLPGI